MSKVDHQNKVLPKYFSFCFFTAHGQLKIHHLLSIFYVIFL